MQILIIILAVIAVLSGLSLGLPFVVGNWIFLPGGIFTASVLALVIIGVVTHYKG